GLAQKVSSFTGLFKSVLARAIVGTLGVIAVVAVTASMVLYLMDSESTAGRIGGRILFASIGLLTAALAVSSLIQAYGWVKACKQVSAASQKAALVGMVIGIVITWGVFIAQWVISGVAIFSLAFNNMLADAIAATCTIILLAALSATGVGAIVVAIIALIDGLIATVCAAAGLNEKSEDSWERQYLCIGISGWITKIFKWAIYSSTYLIDYDNEERLAFVSLEQELRDVSAGMTAGNAMAVTIGVKNTIELSDIPFDWKAAVYFWQYSGSNARSAAFRYSITSGETDLHGGLNRGATSGWADAPGDDTWAKIFDAKTDGYSISLPPAGLNRQPSATLNEGSAVPVQECWAIPILWFLIPVCYIRTERNSIHVPVDASLIVDVLPATLDEFYSITPAGNGYTLDWGRDADLTFGTLKDADGDGLLSKAFPDGNDPDDSKYDTDGDTLSDRYEIANGLNLQNFDTDDDGLTDAEELAKNTDPLRKDTDGDGLPDKEEIQGWLFTYGFTADGTPLETMVYPNPIIPDGDRDGLTDLMEKIYGFNPNSPDEANILDYTLTTQELDSPLILLGLDETGGATAYADSSNFGYGAVCDGSNCPISGFAGRVGNAIHAVDSDPLRLPTSARTISLAGNRPFTLSAWVNLENNPDGELRPDAVILAKLNEQAVELIFSLTNGYPTLIGGGGDIATATCAVTPGQWNHVAVTFDGSTATFYRDGSACGSSAWSTPALAEGITPAEITVGGEPTGTVASFRGYLDEVGLFNRALSAQEVAERLAPANYNFNDTYVRPGEQITYQSQVSNLLQSRFAYGTVSTGIAPQEAVVNAENVLAPETFVLYPDNPVVTGVNTA
ncbi:MAG TPA: LamG-like jellyroll fold domain-containing protein, partial [Anaerolineaceae bacterium]|nr:LamG-like jellyroll fold domain-containing protein [Anaerolineaceae bacterium]